MKMVAWGALLILVYCASTLQLTNANYFGPRQYHSFENDESIEDYHSDEDARPYDNFGSRNGYSNGNYYPSADCGHSRQQYGRFKRTEPEVVEVWRWKLAADIGWSKHLYIGPYPATDATILEYANGLGNWFKTRKIVIWYEEWLQVKGPTECGYWTIKGMSTEVSYVDLTHRDKTYTEVDTRTRTGELKPGRRGVGHLKSVDGFVLGG